MKKIVVIIILCIVIIFTFRSCIYTEETIQETISMFESFDKADNIILLTCFELVINETHYDLDDIKYKDQQCHVLFLEEEGFYSYIHNQDDLSVEFLFTRYENFETISLGAEILPSEIINAFFGDDRFWFRMDDPDTDEFQQMYYSWCISTKQADIVDGDSISYNYEYSNDSNRSERYSFQYTSQGFGGYLDVTDNETGVTKRINRSILKTFDEGKKIRKTKSSSMFNIDRVFEDNGTIYIATIFGVGHFGYPCYYYVYTWNFETEECEFFTCVYFDEYQEWLDDMYIRSN